MSVAETKHSYSTEDGPLHRVMVVTRDETRYRVELQTWRPTVEAAHAAALRLWVALDAVAPDDVRWYAEVTHHTPGIYAGDDWFRVSLGTDYLYGAEGSQELADLLHEQRDRWLLAEQQEAAEQPRGSHVVLVNRDVALVHCLHCDELFQAVTVWRRCDCHKVSARLFTVGELQKGSNAHRAVSVKTLEPARFAVLEGNVRALDGLQPGGEFKLTCVRKENGQNDD